METIPEAFRPAHPPKHFPSVEAMISKQLHDRAAPQAPAGGNQFSKEADSNMEGRSEDTSLAGSTTDVFSTAVRTPSKSPSKSRSLSDSTPKLSPSPRIKERVTKDDHAIATNPKTPRRPDFLSRGLSLQMPARDFMPSPAGFPDRVPLSPQLDARNTYGSPASVLPRHSRGAEFSRACTNLHHSTLAEQSSPDSSPTITQKGIMIPARKHNSISMAGESPNLNPSSLWSTLGTSGRAGPPSSVGSVNMLASDSSSNDSDGDEPMDPDDPDDQVFMTPQVMKMPNLSASLAAASPGGWPNINSPGAPNFMSIHRARLRDRRSRKSSSSASGASSLASPGPASPPQGKSYEGERGGYFARETVMRTAGSRRESVSMLASDLHISSGNDSGDEGGMPAPATPGVVRRPVTRRSNLLPKSRAFGRIRADLLEESAPIDSEVRREAQIIKQVRESDEHLERPQTATSNSSPSLLPTVPGLADGLEDIPEDNDMRLDTSMVPSEKGLFGAFNFVPPMDPRRVSWGNFDYNTYSTPPPLQPRGSSSAVSDDIFMSMESPTVSSDSRPISNGQQTRDSDRTSESARSSTPQPPAPPTAADAIKKAGKRRRDDDFDVSSIKRRAVSPGMSVQNSPILSQSPGQRDLWNTAPKASREGSATSVVNSTANNGTTNNERSNSGGSLASLTPSLGPKRVGLQGMTDTNDGLMKMSIE